MNCGHTVFKYGWYSNLHFAGSWFGPVSISKYHSSPPERIFGSRKVNVGMQAAGKFSASSILNSQGFSQPFAGGVGVTYSCPVGAVPLSVVFIVTGPGLISGHGGAGILRSNCISKSHGLTRISRGFFVILNVSSFCSPAGRSCISEHLSSGYFFEHQNVGHGTTTSGTFSKTSMLKSHVSSPHSETMLLSFTLS